MSVLRHGSWFRLCACAVASGKVCYNYIDVVIHCILDELLVNSVPWGSQLCCKTSCRTEL